MKHMSLTTRNIIRHFFLLVNHKFQIFLISLYYKCCRNFHGTWENQIELPMAVLSFGLTCFGIGYSIGKDSNKTQR